MWVHVRTSTHNLCFGAKKKEKICIPLTTPVFLLYKSGYSLHGHVFLKSLKPKESDDMTKDEKSYVQSKKKKKKKKKKKLCEN